MLLYLFVVKGTEHQFFKTYHACHNRRYIRAVFFSEIKFSGAQKCHNYEQTAKLKCSYFVK